MGNSQRRDRVPQQLEPVTLEFCSSNGKFSNRVSHHWELFTKKRPVSQQSVPHTSVTVAFCTSTGNFSHRFPSLRNSYKEEAGITAVRTSHLCDLSHLSQQREFLTMIPSDGKLSQRRRRSHSIQNLTPLRPYAFPAVGNWH